MPGNRKILAEEQAELKNSAILLNRAQRDVVESAIRQVCEYRGYLLHAINVRTNHVHSVVTVQCKPEHVMDSFKAYATRKLREASLPGPDVKPWARHGSTPYLWTDEELERAVDYVNNGQGDEPSIRHVNGIQRTHQGFQNRHIPGLDSTTMACRECSIP